MKLFLKSSCLLTTLLLPLLTASPLRAQITETYNYTNLNLFIPDGNSSGLASAQNIFSSAIDAITRVRVTLSLGTPPDSDDVFNGDLYVYLQHGPGISILLNRPGRTSGNAFGYGDNGFDVTFADNGANGDIHNYQNLIVPPDGSPVTGEWQPDARMLDPDAVLDTSARNAFLSTFNGLGGNGQWTLFLADVSSGGTVMLNSFSLQITGQPVPEPGTAALFAFGAGALLSCWRKK